MGEACAHRCETPRHRDQKIDAGKVEWRETKVGLVAKVTKCEEKMIQDCMLRGGNPLQIKVTSELEVCGFHLN